MALSDEEITTFNSGTIASGVETGEEDIDDVSSFDDDFEGVTERLAPETVVD